MSHKAVTILPYFNINPENLDLKDMFYLKRAS